jgi:hypothetical protein
MQMEVLADAGQTIGRLRPMLVLENPRTDQDLLNGYLDSFGYSRFVKGLDTIAVHPSDATSADIEGILSTAT